MLHTAQDHASCKQSSDRNTEHEELRLLMRLQPVLKKHTAY